VEVATNPSMDGWVLQREGRRGAHKEILYRIWAYTKEDKEGRVQLERHIAYDADGRVVDLCVDIWWVNWLPLIRGTWQGSLVEALRDSGKFASVQPSDKTLTLTFHVDSSGAPEAADGGSGGACGSAATIV
jgi:hypothetical protein